MKPGPRAIVCGGLAAGVLLAGSTPSWARVVKTRGVGQPGQGVTFILGAGFEYQSDAERTEFGFPIYFEAALTPTINLTAEPAFTVIEGGDGGSIRGFEDLETTVSLEIVRERRYRPAFALEGGIKWPTAAHDEFGTGATDFALGVIVSKEFIPAEIGFDARFLRVGTPEEGRVQDLVEWSFAAEWHLSRSVDLTGEMLTIHGIGPLRGTEAPLEPGEGGDSGSTFEATLGLAEYFGPRFKLEQGVIFQNDGTWQAVLAWEYDFGEGR